MTLQHITQPSNVLKTLVKQLNPHADIPPYKSATPCQYSTASTNPSVNKRISWQDHTISYQMVQGCLQTTRLRFKTRSGILTTGTTAAYRSILTPLSHRVTSSHADGGNVKLTRCLYSCETASATTATASLIWASSSSPLTSRVPRIPKGTYKVTNMNWIELAQYISQNELK